MRRQHPTVTGMNAGNESRNPVSHQGDVEGETRAVTEHLRDEHRRLTDEAARNGRSVAGLPHVTGIERVMERKRIARQILAVVVPWRHEMPLMDPADCDLFRVRARALLNYLDVAVLPYPDLQDALAAARAELEPQRPGPRQ